MLQRNRFLTSWKSYASEWKEAVFPRGMERKSCFWFNIASPARRCYGSGIRKGEVRWQRKDVVIVGRNLLPIRGWGTVRRLVLLRAKSWGKRRTSRTLSVDTPLTGVTDIPRWSSGGSNILTIKGDGDRRRRSEDPRVRYKSRDWQKLLNLQKRPLSFFVRYKPRSFLKALP